ncbi:MAG: hypothetical protein DMF56_21695 [Acidobacteria bacterium]|nr:MAG: hypothetical protein DMF56_21695 [Acidobacteriota bacterium]
MTGVWLNHLVDEDFGGKTRQLLETGEISLSTYHSNTTALLPAVVIAIGPGASLGDVKRVAAALGDEPGYFVTFVSSESPTASAVYVGAEVFDPKEVVSLQIVAPRIQEAMAMQDVYEIIQHKLKKPGARHQE